MRCRRPPQILVQQSLATWLADQIQVQKVTVTAAPGGDHSQLLVEIDYVLIETQTLQTTRVRVTS